MGNLVNISFIWIYIFFCVNFFGKRLIKDILWWKDGFLKKNVYKYYKGRSY